MRTRNLYDPSSNEAYPLSRSKVELFLQCPRCFYLDRRNGIGRPDGPPFTLNLAVDALLKREFDSYRVKEQPHPIMTTFGIDAIPFRHKDLNLWRDGPQGIRFFHSASHFDVYGLIDDVWVKPDGELIMVDYKATSTVTTITLENRDSYKRQIEFYQWLFRRNGFRVSPVGYFLYVNAVKDRDMFDRTLEFTMQMIAHEGSDAWVDDALIGAHECLQHDLPPPSVEGCEWCTYRKDAERVENP
jgi:hypothetical protein